MSDYGAFNFNAGANFNDNEVTNVIDAPDVLQNAGFDQANLFDDVELRCFETASPDSKLNLGVTWNYDRYTTTLRTTRYGEVEDPRPVEARNEIIPSEWITDLDVRIALTEGLPFLLVLTICLMCTKATRELVDDVTTFSRLFPYSGFSPYGLQAVLFTEKSRIAFN